MNKNTKNSVSNIVENSVIGGGIGATLLGAHSWIKHPPGDPYYSTMLSSTAKDAAILALKNKNKFLKAVTLGGLLGSAVSGAYTVASKDKKENPSALKTLVSAGIVGAGAIAAYKHRGKIKGLTKGTLEDINYWRGHTGIDQFIKGETWQPGKEYAVRSSLDGWDSIDLQHVLSKEYHVPEVKLTIDAPKGHKNLDTIHGELDSKHKFIVGGDPEVSLYQKGVSKVLPVSVLTYPKETRTRIKDLTADFSVHGGEAAFLRPGTADEFTNEVKKFQQRLVDQLSPNGIEIAEISIHPKNVSGEYRASSRLAGGHLHIPFMRDTSLSEDADRLKLQKRIALITAPINFTHPSSTTRYGLHRGTQSYGKKLIDDRSLKRLAWTPEHGFDVQSNMEFRLPPSYVGDAKALNHQIKLINIALNHPKAKLLDDASEQLYKLSRNESKALFEKNVRNHIGNSLNSFFNEIELNDPEINNYLENYLHGRYRKIKN